MKKRSFFAIGAAVLILGAVGVTFAISQGKSVIDNELAVAKYQTSFTEEFTAPSDWSPCQTIAKTITAKNDSQIPVAVRVKLEEDWIASDGTTHLPLVSATSGLTMAQINFTPNAGWTKEGEYYVYDTDLAPGATTTSLTTGVTMNCNANLDTSDNAEATADGAYADAEYHLKATIQTIQADAKNEWWPQLTDTIIAQINDPFAIDFTRKAVISADRTIANGNGVNKYLEGGKEIYYYRGNVENNVLWANFCWKILRTTATGGVKLVYNGLPTDVDGTKQCLARNTDADIAVSEIKYNGNQDSLADIGYMYGARIGYSTLYSRSFPASFTFSNDVTRSGDTYTLDTSDGQSISGTWADQRLTAATRYHYFCTDGATTCDDTKIGYIHYFGSTSSISYVGIGGYDDIEAAKTAMFANEHDSLAKATVETWFENENLDGHTAGTRNYEDDLEDVVFCNDRTMYGGAFASKDSDATPTDNINMFSTFGAYKRIAIRNSSNNFEPSLDCPRAEDSFTKSAANGNGKLKHKVGLITADEMTMVGQSWTDGDSLTYLYTNSMDQWTMTPAFFYMYDGRLFTSSGHLDEDPPIDGAGYRPVVSLKSSAAYFVSGTGTKADPYIVP